MYIGTRFAKEVLSYPSGGLAGLDESLAGHRGCSCGVALGPDKAPRAVLGRKLGLRSLGVVVLGEATGEVVGRADVELARAVLQDVRPGWTIAPHQPPRVGLEPTT